MSEIKPLYQRYAHLYAYDTETKKHMLKSGVLYKKRFAVYPNRFVESVTMFSDPIPEVPKLNITHIDQKLTTTQIGPKTSIVSYPTKSQEQIERENEEIRNNVQNIIQDELRKNKELYKNKDANEMSILFRDLLLQKLTVQSSASPYLSKGSSNNENSQIQSKKAKKFKLIPPVEYEEPEYEEPEYEEPEYEEVYDDQYDQYHPTYNQEQYDSQYNN